MNDDATKRTILDEEHLRLLALFHYISGALTIAFSSLFVFHLMFMQFMLNNPELFDAQGQAGFGPESQQFMRLFVAVFGTFIVLGIAYGIAQIVSGRFIKQHRYRMFSFIVALPNLLLLPYGTILAIFTVMVLDRDSVKSLYREQAGT